MSSFSNGNYVPSGMDFSDWVEYLEEKRDAEKFALIDKEFEEFFGEFLDLEPEEEEEEFKLSLPKEHLSFLKHEADKFIDGVKESLSGMTKSGKLEALAEMQRETRERLLFNFIRDNKDEVFYSVLRSPSNSFLEEERKNQTFINFHKIANAKSFDPQNEELMKDLKQYDTVLKNEPWAKKHSAYVDKWMNSKAGDKTSVFTKLLDAKLKVLSDSVSQEPEQTKKKSPKRSFDMER